MYSALLEREDLRNLKIKILSFIERELALGENISVPTFFNRGTWDSLGKEGLLGLNISTKYGGFGRDHLSVVVAGQELVKNGLSMGIAMSWMLHLCASHFLIEKHGSEIQKEQILTRLATGEITISFAYGEMGSGGRPSNFKTYVERFDDYYILNGKKDFLTNGPIADVFVVFPLTEINSKRILTAYIITKDIMGVKTLEPIDVRFLNPSPHCSIVFKNCKVLSDNILGREGFAYEEIVKSWRAYEELYLTGLYIGGMERQISLFIDCYKNQNIQKEITSYIGELVSLVNALKIIAYEIATLIDKNSKIDIYPPLVSFGVLSHKFQQLYKEMVKETELIESLELKYLTGSIENLLGIGQYLFNINKNKLGRSMFLN